MATRTKYDGFLASCSSLQTHSGAIDACWLFIGAGGRYKSCNSKDCQKLANDKADDSSLNSSNDHSYNKKHKML